jgi:hypothetical protein
MDAQSWVVEIETKTGQRNPDVTKQTLLLPLTIIL